MKQLSQQMHRSPVALAMASIAVVYLLVAWGFDEGLPPQGQQGLCFPPPALWPLPRWIDVCGGILLNLCLIGLMALINKGFNVLRSNTRLHIGLFTVMAAAVPRLVVNVNSGVLLAIAICLCMLLIFDCYESPGMVRRVYLAFLILSAGSTMQYSFVVYIPVMWLMTAQMRIFGVRTFLASLFGLATPWIILLGFGLVDIREIHAPQLMGIFGAFRENSALYMLEITAVTAFMLMVAIVLNLSRTIAYNARARAYNGALTLIAFVTVVAIGIDYNNLLDYLPLLNVCAAYQLTHWFVNHSFDRQYVAVAGVCTIYFGFYLWRIFL